MTYLFIFILGILVGSVSFRYFINQQLKTTTTNLKTITQRSTNERLRISSGQKEIKKLVKQINLQLEKEQQTRLLIDEEFLLLR
ncbi:MAG: sensor histidine kinase, partial [Carnobacterium sp.]